MRRSLYVKFDDETWGALHDLATEERRAMPDQAFIMLRAMLRKSTMKLELQGGSRSL